MTIVFYAEFQYIGRETKWNVTERKQNDLTMPFANQQANRQTIVQQRRNANFLLAPTVRVGLLPHKHGLEILSVCASSV